MTTINRLNATISDHNTVANFVALFLLMSICVASAAAIAHSGSLAESSYDTFVQSIPTTAQVGANTTGKSQTTQQTSAATLRVGNSSPNSVQSQPSDVAAQLQPAQSINYYQTTVTADTLQSGTNTVQVTGGADLQSTVSILQ